MAEYIVQTSDKYTQLIVNTNSELIGDYPNITFRIHYNFKIRLTAYGSWYVTSDFWFHQTHHSVKLNINFGNGGGTTGVLASGHINLPIYGRTTTHVPGCGVNAPHCFSASSLITEKQTIGAGTLSTSLVAQDHDSATIKLSYTSPRNYSHARIYNITDGKWAISTAINGNNTITGLKSGKEYIFHCELWYRDGTAYYLQKKITVKTTGFSYLVNDVDITLGSLIKFDLKSYSDDFTNKILIEYNNLKLYYGTGIKTTNLTYTFEQSMTYEHIDAIYASIPEDTKAIGKISIFTFDGDIEIGVKEYQLVMNIAVSECKPTLTYFRYRDISRAVEVSGSSETIVKNVSTVELYESNATARKGASIASFSMLAGSSSVNATLPLRSEVIRENTGIMLTVTDTRGLQTSYFKAFNRFVNYEPITLDSLQALRVQNENGTDVELSFNGKVYTGYIGSKKNQIRAEYFYKELNSGIDYVRGNSDINPILSADFFNKEIVKGDLDSNGFSKGKAFYIKIIVSDLLTNKDRDTELTKVRGLQYYGDEGVSYGGEYTGIIVNGSPSVLEFWNERKGQMEAIENVQIEAESGEVMERLTNIELENMLN